MKISKETKVLEILGKYSSENENYASDLLALEEKIESPDIVIPVLGTQGMGKSTLINSLFGEDVMPNEADETTCIPVEVRYGTDRVTKVHFQNGTMETIDGGKTSLANYVDNNFNPGNEKKVSHIVLSRPYDILKTGVVIVDLPGVGSLTKANEETTRKYIEKLCAAVFVVSTSPPILQSDSKFIKSVWRGISSAYFVQNVWDDNSKSEVEEALHHNQYVLEKIAEEINVPMISKVIPVNAYAAAKGTFEQNPEMIQKSNVNELIQVLTDFAGNYTKTTSGDFEKRVIQMIEAVEKVILNQVRQSELSKEELLAELKLERNQFETATEEIENVVNTIKSQLASYKRQVRSFAQEIATKKTGLLRTEVFHLIDQGVVDGERLAEAFNNYQVSYGSEACDEAYEKLYEITAKIQREFEEIVEIIDKENMESVDAEAFNKNQSFKWEKGVDAGIKLGSSIGGIIACMAVGGPLGLVAGLAISIVGGLIGGASKKAVTSQRANQTKSEIEPYISQFESNIVNSINQTFESYEKDMEGKLTDYVESRNERLDEINHRISNLMRQEENIQGDVQNMKADIAYLTEWRTSWTK